MKKFFVFLSIYSLLLAVMIGSGLYVFWQYLACYEASLPGPVVSQYREKQMQSDFEAFLSDYAVEHETDFQSAAQIRAYLRERFENVKLTLRKEYHSDSSDADYAVFAGDQRIGAMNLAYRDQGTFSFGRKACLASCPQMDSGLDYSQEYSVTAPSGAMIYVENVLLTAQNAFLESVPGEQTELKKYFPAPEYVQYRFRFYGKPNVTVGESDIFLYHLSQKGMEYSVAESLRWENCDDFVAQCEGFIKAYVAYGAKAGPYGLVLQYLVPETELYNRIVSSVSGMHWANGVNPGIRNYSVETIYPYGSAVICDTHYSLTYTNGSKYHANMRLMFMSTDGVWKIWNMEMY